jgi:uncharacterized protein
MPSRMKAASVARMASTRFVTDASLEFLARRLRFLGYDVVTRRGARLEELFETAAREQRTVLTLSARHPRPWAHVPVVRAARGDAAAALRALVADHAPAGPPFSRCPGCGAALRERTAFEAHGEVPSRVTRAGGPLTWCPVCGHWFWVGSHVAHIVAWLEAALGRPLSELRPPEPPAPA